MELNIGPEIILDRKLFVCSPYYDETQVGGVYKEFIPLLGNKNWTYTVHPKSTGLYSITIFYQPYYGDNWNYEYWGWTENHIYVNDELITTAVVEVGCNNFANYATYSGINVSITRLLKDGDVVKINIPCNNITNSAQRVQSAIVCLTELL